MYRHRVGRGRMTLVLTDYSETSVLVDAFVAIEQPPFLIGQKRASGRSPRRGLLTRNNFRGHGWQL